MQWQSHRHLQHRIEHAQLKNWLLDRGSLTERLLETSKGKFRVEILQQRWGVARIDEAKLLGLKPRQASLIREVVLYGNNQPWVYARSVLPAKSLNRSLRHLKHLGNKPLGAILFSDPHMQRGMIEIARLNPEQLPIVIDRAVWGRRSVFFLRQQPLLVSEVFLPVFINQVC